MNLDWGCAGASSQQVMLSLGDEINMNDMNMPIQWQEGSSESVEIGYLNPNGQQCCGHCGVPGSNLCVMNKKQFAKVRLDILRCGLLSGKTPGVGLYLAEFGKM